MDTTEQYGIFSNENYVVEITEYEGERIYVIVNRVHDVEEARTSVLPEALMIAVNWNLALEEEHHLWPLRSRDTEKPETKSLLQ